MHPSPAEQSGNREKVGEEGHYKIHGGASDNQCFAYDEDKKPSCDDIVSSLEVMNREHRGCNNQRNSVKAPKESTH